MSSPTIVLVTGGNGGIGYETVKAFFESPNSYHILMGSRSLENANEAIRKLHGECPGATNTVEPLQPDLTSDESIESAFESVKLTHGYLDALVYNAGRCMKL